MGVYLCAEVAVVIMAMVEEIDSTTRTRLLLISTPILIHLEVRRRLISRLRWASRPQVSPLRQVMVHLHRRWATTTAATPTPTRVIKAKVTMEGKDTMADSISSKAGVIAILEEGPEEDVGMTIPTGMEEVVVEQEVAEAVGEGAQVTTAADIDSSLPRRTLGELASNGIK